MTTIGRGRGVNFGGWFSQVDAIEEKDPSRFPGLVPHLDSFLGPDDFGLVASWGFDHVRLPVDWQNVFTPDFSPREEILGRLDKAIADITGTGMQVIFDLHRCPGHDFHGGITVEQPLFCDSDVLERVKRVWSYLAERYGAMEGVALELLNEPTARESDTWNRICGELFRCVREHAPRSTIVVGSNRWNHASEFAHLTPIDDDNVLYSFHFYNPVLFTHQKAPWLSHPVFHESRQYPGVITLPEGADHRLPLEGGLWDRDRLAREIEAVTNFREKWNLPVSCDEFGVYKAGPDRICQLAWLRDLLGLLGERGIGWSYWNYRNLDFGIVSRGESLFENDPCYANEDRCDRELVELLRAV